MKQSKTSDSRYTPWLYLVFLIICCIASLAVLGGILYYSTTDSDLIIDLIPKDEAGAYRIVSLPSNTSSVVRNISSQSNSGSEPLRAFMMEDEYGTVWNTDTKVDIFKSSYENDTHKVTVAGKNSEKVIAPGTENSYTFSLKNNDVGFVDYKMTMNSFFSGLPDDKIIPVEVRIKSQNGWLLGDEDTWEPVLELKNVEDSAILFHHTSAVYTLEWRWPFESGQDELDTWLGNQAGDITLTVQITTQSNYHWPVIPPIVVPIPDLLNGDDHIAYIYGYEDGTVRPNANITRAEVAAIFYRLLKSDVRKEFETKKHVYSDIPDNAWYLTEVATMTNAGILNGYPDGTFRGDNSITRAELAAVLSRLSETEVAYKTKSKFTDISAHWAKKEIMKIEQFNWFVGYEDNTFRPNNNITRAETATMINRVLHRLPEREEDLHADMHIWTDNSDPEAWYYIAIQEATHTHTYRRLRGTREQWNEILELGN